jgi:hypothetical protein
MPRLLVALAVLLAAVATVRGQAPAADSVQDVADPSVEAPGEGTEPSLLEVRCAAERGGAAASVR